MISWVVIKEKKEFPKSFMYNEKEITNPQEIADKFNDFFTNVGPNLSNKIPTHPTKTFRSYLTKQINIVSRFHWLIQR